VRRPGNFTVPYSIDNPKQFMSSSNNSNLFSFPLINLPGIIIIQDLIIRRTIFKREVFILSNNRILFLFIETSTCYSRCKHCFINGGRKINPIKFEDLKNNLNLFLKFRDKNNDFYSKMASAIYDCSLNYPYLNQLIRFYKCNDIEGWSNIPINGFRLRSKEEWLPYLESLLEAGLIGLIFTLYGLKENHNWFAGRDGDFNNQFKLADLWHEVGVNLSGRCSYIRKI